MSGGNGEREKTGELKEESFSWNAAQQHAGPKFQACVG